jgi:hypothetical protein
MEDSLDIQNRTVGLVVNAPELFLQDDFLAWLNDPTKTTFTWHKCGDTATEYSDVMLLVDSNYEGDSADMPEDVWKAVCDLAYGEYCGGAPTLPATITSHITVRLTNIE